MKTTKLILLFLVTAFSCGQTHLNNTQDCVTDTQNMVSFIKSDDFNGLYKYLSKRLPLKKRNISASTLSDEFASVKVHIDNSTDKRLKYDLFEDPPRDWYYGFCTVTIYSDTTAIFRSNFNGTSDGTYELAYIENVLDIPKKRRKAQDVIKTPPK